MSATTREEFIAQLRQLADLLEQHPAVPMSYAPHLLCPIERDAWHELDQLAAYLNEHDLWFTDIERPGSGQRTITLLGMYEVYSVTSDCMARYEAASTYGDSVTP